MENWIELVVKSGILGGAVLGMLYVHKKIVTFETNIKDIKESIKDIPILNKDVAVLQEFKVSTQKFIDNNLFKAKSPLQLTELGEKLVKDSGLAFIFDTIKDDLVEKLYSMSPSTKYEVQEKARSLMDSLVKYEAFKPIHTYAFKEGQDVGQILRAGSILLRDYYFTQHPEIKD